MSEDKELKEGALYEIGFLVLPTLSEEEASAVYQEVSKMISEEGGSVVSGELPRLRGLAYKISKTDKGGSESFDTAYLGYIFFRAEGSLSLAIATKVKDLSSILRYTCLSVSEEALNPRKERRMRPADSGLPKKELTPEELDKTIEQLVVG